LLINILTLRLRDTFEYPPEFPQVNDVLDLINASDMIQKISFIKISIMLSTILLQGQAKNKMNN